MRTIGAFICVLLVAGCAGKTPTQEDVAKLRRGMSLAEVENILGSGKSLTGDERPGEWVRADKDIVCRKWGGEKQSILIGFRDGKLFAYEARGFRITDPERDAIIAEAPIKSDLYELNGLLNSYASKHEGRLPTNLEHLVDFAKQFPHIYAKVKDGTYIVRWGFTAKSAVLAYEKDAPEKGGYVLGPNSRVEKMTADALKVVLGKTKGTQPTKAAGGTDDN